MDLKAEEKGKQAAKDGKTRTPPAMSARGTSAWLEGYDSVMKQKSKRKANRQKAGAQC